MIYVLLFGSDNRETGYSNVPYLRLVCKWEKYFIHTPNTTERRDVLILMSVYCHYLIIGPPQHDPRSREISVVEMHYPIHPSSWQCTMYTVHNTISSLGKSIWIVIWILTVLIQYFLNNEYAIQCTIHANLFRMGADGTAYCGQTPRISGNQKEKKKKKNLR